MAARKVKMATSRTAAKKINYCEASTAGSDDDFDSESKSPVAQKLTSRAPKVKRNASHVKPEPIVPEFGKRHFQVIPQNILHVADKYSFGYPGNQLCFKHDIHKKVLVREIDSFVPNQRIHQFQRRITAVEWHPRLPYTMAAACKGGDVVLARGRKIDGDSVVFDSEQIHSGSGPGGAVFSLKFHKDNPSVVYLASLEGNFKSLNLEDPSKEIIYHDTRNFDLWFTAMDVSHFHQTILGCDNKGSAHLYNINGQEINTLKLHKKKIHHCEFNKRLQYLFATASLEPDRAVCLWDIRCLREQSPLQSLSHTKGANVATFNSTGSRLLTNDQYDEIKVFDYQGEWKEVRKIYHPHRQFQHLTPIEASWHPLHDLIVIGRYPTPDEAPTGTDPSKIPRPIEIIDPDAADPTSVTLCRLYHPSNYITSLNCFNITGQVLASGLGRDLVTWQANRMLEQLSDMKLKPGSSGLSQTTRNALRGRRLDSEDDDDDGIDLQKRALKKRKKSTDEKRENQKQKKSNASSASRRCNRKPPSKK